MDRVISFPESRIVRRPGSDRRFPHRRVFHVATVTTQQNGLKFKWDAKYWVKRGPNAQYWHVFCSTDEVSKGYLSMSTYTPEGVIDYFKSMGLNISTERWLEMGWLPSIRPKAASVYSLRPQSDEEQSLQRSTRPEQLVEVW